MSLEALPGQAPGPQSTDQALPSWLTYSPYTTITRTYTTTRETVLYDPNGNLAPTVSVTVQVGVTTDTLYAARPLPLAYTGPTPYPPLGTLYTIPGQGQGQGQSQSSSQGQGSPRPTASGPAPSITAGQPSASGPGSSDGAGGGNGGGGGGSGSAAPTVTPAPSSSQSQGVPGASSGSGLAPGGSAGGTSFSAGGSAGGSSPGFGTTTTFGAGTIVFGNTTIIGSTTIIGASPSGTSGGAVPPVGTGGTTIFGGTTIIDGSSTIINPNPSGTLPPGGGNPLERQSSGLTPAQLAGTLVAAIGGFILLCLLLLCCLLRRRRRQHERLDQSQGIGPEKYQYGNTGIMNDPSAAGAGYGASGAGGAGEKSALLGAGAAGVGAGAGAAAAASRRRPSNWTDWFTSRGNRITSDPITGGSYTALPQANVGAAPVSRARQSYGHGRTESGGSALSAGLAGASAAAVAAMAAISSRRRHRREERERVASTGGRAAEAGAAGAWGRRKGAVREEEWEADELHDDGGSGFFVVNPEARPLNAPENPFADSEGSSHANHHAEGVAAAAGAAVIAAGRGKSIPPSTSSLMVNDPQTDARKSKYRAMANLGVGGSGPRFFGAMMGTRSASGTESGTGSNSNSGPSQRNVSGGTHLTPATQPSVRSVSGGQTYAVQDSGTSTHSGGPGSGVIFGIGAAAGAAALGLAQAARRISSGEKRLSRKPVPAYASSGTDTEAEDHQPSYLGKRKRARGGGGRLYGAVGTGPVGEEDEEDEGDDGLGQRERQGLMQDYGNDTYDPDASTGTPLTRPSPRFASSSRAVGTYDVGEGWPDTALVGAAAGALAGSSAARRSHRRSSVQGDAQHSSGDGSGSGNASAPWSSGSTHEVPKSSSGALLSSSSAGHRSGSADDLGGGVTTSLSPRPRPARSRTSTTTGSPKDMANLMSFANVGASSSSPQDRSRLPAFPEGFGSGDLSAHAERERPHFEITNPSGDSLDRAGAMTAAAAGTGGALGLLAARHRSSTVSIHSHGAENSSEDNSQSVRTPDESGLPPRHSNFLSRGTHLLGPGAAASTRSSASSVPVGPVSDADHVDAEPQEYTDSTMGRLALPPQGAVSEFGEQGPHRKVSRNTLGSRQLSTIFGSESEPSSGVGAPSSVQQHDTITSGHGSALGSGSGSGPESHFDSLGARSGSTAGLGAAAATAGAIGAPASAHIRPTRGSGASDPRTQPSLMSALQQGRAEMASPAGTFGNADLASPPGSPHRNSLAGAGAGGIRIVNASHSARASRSPTPSSAAPAGRIGAGGELGLASAEASRPMSPLSADLESGGAEHLSQDTSDGGLFSSVAAGLRRLGGGWISGTSSRPETQDGPGRDRRTSIGVATMGARTAAGTAAGTPTGRGTPARTESSPSGDATSRRPSGAEVLSNSSSMSSQQRPNLARLSTATSQAVAGSREGSGSEPSAVYSGSLSSGSVGGASAGLDSVSHRTHHSSSNGHRSAHSGSGSGSGSRRSRGGRSDGGNSGAAPSSAGSGSGISYSTSELARRNTLSTHAETDEDALRRASMSGATSPAVYTASEGASGDFETTAARRSLSAHASPALQPTVQLPSPDDATAQSTIRLVGGDRANRPGMPSQLAPPPSGLRLPSVPPAGQRSASASASASGSGSGSWRQSPRVATVAQRAVEAQTREQQQQAQAQARSSGTGTGTGSGSGGAGRNRSQSTSTGSPDDFEWGALTDTFPTPLDRALREAEQRDLEEQQQGQQPTKYNFPKFLRF